MVPRPRRRTERGDEKTRLVSAGGVGGRESIPRPRVGKSSKAGAADCSGRSGVWCQLHEGRAPDVYPEVVEAP